jgi:hypothetical protein
LLRGDSPDDDVGEPAGQGLDDARPMTMTDGRVIRSVIDDGDTKQAVIADAAHS